MLLQSGRICGGTHGACEAGDPGPRVAAPYWHQSQGSSSGFASQNKGKGQPEVKAVPKPKKMRRDAQLPPPARA